MNSLKLTKLVRILKNTITAFFRLLIYCIPRSKKLIVYGGAMDMFVDNCKYQYIHNYSKLPNYKHIWLTKNNDVYRRLNSLNFKVYKSFSLKGLFYTLRAKYFIYDDGLIRFTCPHLSSGALRINLWHGVPAKSITPLNVNYHTFYTKKYSFFDYIIRGHNRGDLGIYTTNNLYEIFTQFYQLPPDRVLISGYPRTKPLLMSENERHDFITKYESLDYKILYNKILNNGTNKIIYMPTFRDNNLDYLLEAIPSWNELNNACILSNTFLYIKVHRITPTPDISSYSNIICIPNDIDIYPLLSLFDCLITDYSSIMFDYALTGKHIIIYNYDMESYITNSRNLYPYFINLIKDLNNISSFKKLLSFIENYSHNELNLKEFPVTNFFDCPENIGVIEKLINNKVDIFNIAS